MAIPSWLLDVTRAAQYLTQLSLESAAQASLILRSGKLWAYAGEISQPAVEELVKLISQYIAGGDGGDLARFVHLDAVPGDYMLYATRLIDGMMLVVVYNVETPFSKIRSQASKLARALADRPPETVQPGTRTVKQPDVTTQVELPNADIPPLFDNVPPPTAARQQNRSVPQVSAKQQTGLGEQQGHKQQGQLEDTQSSRKSETISSPYGSVFTPVVEERSSMGQQADQPADLRYPVVYSLYLACTLVPRIPTHTINPPLSTLLIEWVKKLCLAFGWRLEQISIGEEFLSWVVSLSPSTSPGFHIRAIRHRTSKSIFEAYPNLERDNPSGDFWALGYMISSRSDLPNSDTIDAFIRQTRRQQGEA